tara:strand:+ start:66 stop:323 length:258 start_codon:yes stop_codon:yes gene_type:complete
MHLSLGHVPETERGYQDLYDHSGSLPTFVTMTDGKTHDIRVAKNSDKLDFALLPDSIISIDTAYMNYQWLYSPKQSRGIENPCPN